jgi:hypothetical protein
MQSWTCVSDCQLSSAPSTKHSFRQALSSQVHAAARNNLVHTIRGWFVRHEACFCGNPVTLGSYDIQAQEPLVVLLGGVRAISMQLAEGFAQGSRHISLQPQLVHLEFTHWEQSPQYPL